MKKNQIDNNNVCLSKAELINRIISDKAEAKNMSEFEVIEQIMIFDGLLPRNSTARTIIEEHLYGNESNIGKTLSNLFSINSDGEKSKHSTRYENFLKLVHYARNQECICNTILTGKEKILPHCILQIESVIKRLEMLENKDKDYENKIIYSNEVKFGKDLLLELKNEPQCSHIFNFYTIIINNWKDLKGWSITYSLLNDLVLLEPKWRNNFETRLELLEIINEISNEWTD